MKNTTIKYQKYPEYKDSGVEWLGEIPKHWEVNKLFSVCRFVRGNSTFSKDELLSIGEYVALQYGKSYKVTEVDEKYRFYVNNEFYKSSQVVNYGDTIIISTSETIEDLGHTVFYKRNDLGLIGGEQILLKPYTGTVNSKYLHFSSKLFSKELRKYATGIKVFRFNINDLKTIYTPIPPLSEQTAIADFLDDKTAKIDRAIAQKEKLIALLKERKQIIIQNAVTKGLNPNVKLKDSGIDWIGKIPEHWEVKRFRYIFNLGKGLTITKENLIDEGIPCINYGEIHSKFGFEVNPDIHELKCIDEEYLNTSPSSLLKNGDFIFADTSEDIEGSGNFTYLNSNKKTFAGYHTIIAKPKIKLFARFLAYVFDSLSFRNQIRSSVKGVKVFSITQSILKEPLVWFPPIDEQKQISSYLDNQSAKIDKAISLQQKQIEKLKEYKTVLIDNAVTGKIKVS